MATTTQIEPGVVRSLIPARVDRLPWSRFHTRLVMALGVAWVLDGLEIIVASSVAGALAQPDTLNMSSTAVGAIATVYLAGEVVGALVFGRLSDRLGRRKLFMVTLGVYLIGSGLTALTLGTGPDGSSTCTRPGSSRAPASGASTRRSTRRSMR
jgi:MFS family permease